MAISFDGSSTTILALSGFDKASRILKASAYKFATGEKHAKPSENIFDTVEALIGKAQITYINSARATVTRLRSMLNTRTGALNTLLDIVSDLENIAQQASGVLPNTLRAANMAVFQQLLNRAQSIPLTANYAGIPLLSSFGTGKNFIESNPNVLNVCPPAPTGINTLQPYEDQDTATFTFTSNIVAGDTLTIGGVIFTYVTTNPSPNPEDHQILIGSTTNGTV